jgi:hypothetical protein
VVRGGGRYPDGGGSVSAPALGDRRPVAPRHEDTVVAFHSGRLNPPTRADEVAARVLVDRLLCVWCGNSRVARLCKCRWSS